MTTISATAARAKFYDLLEEVARSGKKIGITNKGETQAVLISAEELAAMEVTMETLADRELMEALRKGEEDLKAGRFVSLEEMEKELGLSDNGKDVSGHAPKSSKKRS